MKKRFYLIDQLRAIGIIYVVIYHLIYDLTYIFPIGITFIDQPWMNILRGIMVGMLILISGISCNFSGSNLKRSIKTLGCAGLISIVTYSMGSQYFISFGILHFLGVSMLIFSIFQKIVVKVSIKVGLIGSLILFTLFKINESVFFFWCGRPTIFTFIIGMHPDLFSSIDYYPLFPWIFIFFMGVYLGRCICVYKDNTSLTPKHSRLLSSIGQHTMIIYLLHQPIIYGFLFIIYKL